MTHRMTGPRFDVPVHAISPMIARGGVDAGPFFAATGPLHIERPMPTNTILAMDEREQDAMCVRLHPAALDAEHVDATRAYLIHLVAQHGCRLLRLDFGAVESVRSEVLAKLLVLRREVVARGGQVVIDNVNPLIGDVFEITRLGPFFRVRRAATESSVCAESDSRDLGLAA